MVRKKTLWKLHAEPCRLGSCVGRRKRFWRATSGVSTMEMAFLLPVLLLVGMGSLEIGLVIYANVVLEGATASAARIGKTGFTKSGITREAYIKNEVYRLSRGLLKPEKITFSFTTYKDFSYTGGTAGIGGAGDVVVYQTEYKWRIITPLVSKLFTNPYPITARVVARNEAF